MCWRSEFGTNTLSLCSYRALTGFLYLHFNKHLVYMWTSLYLIERGPKELRLYITNLHIKRPRMTVNWGIRSRKMFNFQLQMLEFSDKKAVYNEVRLYLQINDPRGRIRRNPIVFGHLNHAKTCNQKWFIGPRKCPVTMKAKTRGRIPSHLQDLQKFLWFVAFSRWHLQAVEELTK